MFRLLLVYQLKTLSNPNLMKSHYQILIVGGGNAGISVAAQLLRQNSSLDIGILEPSDRHYYQPAWTLVGAGAFDVQNTVRPMQSVIPQGATWIQDAVTTFAPEQNQVSTQKSGTFSYDWLVIAPGIQLDWSKIPGLVENLGKNGVCSNYSFQTAPYTWETIRNFKGGTALFTNPNTPVKCGGAPHKIMYMAGDYFRKNGLLSKADIHYLTPADFLFAVPEYNKTLLGVCERIGAKLDFFHELVEIDGDKKVAYFQTTRPGTEPERIAKPFDMIHVTPPQSAPDFLKNSSLTDGTPGGWISVNKDTLQHTQHANIFAIGDASNLPTSKTGAAIRKQAPVLVANLLRAIQKQPIDQAYNGYTACPLVTGYGKLVMAEFDYNKKPEMSFPIDQTQEHYSMWFLKKHLLPRMYWAMILKGRA